MSLLVLLETIPDLRLIDGAMERTFVADGRCYTDVIDCEMTGFYDWLRDSSGDCVGVLYYPNDPDDSRFNAFFSRLRELKYVRVLDANVCEIVLVECSVRTNLQSGCEQEFVESRVFTSSDDRFAMSFDLGALTAQDIENLVGRGC